MEDREEAEDKEGQSLLGPQQECVGKGREVVLVDEAMTLGDGLLRGTLLGSGEALAQSLRRFESKRPVHRQEAS